MWEVASRFAPCHTLASEMSPILSDQLNPEGVECFQVTWGDKFWKVVTVIITASLHEAMHC